MDYQSYLGWGLNNFEDIANALTKFKDGGWWVRKIDYKDAFNREITEGPYTEKEAKKKAYNWNKFFTLKDKNITTAKAYSFKDLICNHQKDYKFLKKHLYEEYIWRPPQGTELICLLLSKEKILLLENEKKDKTNNLEKIKVYVLDNDIKLIKHKNYEIYYKIKDYMAKEQVEKLKLLIDDYGQNKEQLQWLYDTAVDKKFKRGLESVIIPHYIKNFNKDSRPYTLEYFKKLESCKEKEDKIKTLLCYLKDSNRDFTFPLKDKTKYDIGYKFPLLYGNNDYDVKNLVISYSNDKELMIDIKDDNDKYYVKLKNNYITFNLPLDNQKDNIFNDKLIVLMLFISKTLKINNLILKDNLKEYCSCIKITNKEDFYVYINIVKYLSDQESIYDEMGFVEINKEKRQDVIDKFKDKTIKEFFPNQEEDSLNIFMNKTLRDLSRDYLEGYCEFPYICELLQKITIKIYNQLNKCCFEHSIELDDFPLFKLKEKLNKI